MGSGTSSSTSPRGFRYEWTSPHGLHWTRRISSSYFDITTCVVSPLHLGQYASTSEPTSSTSSSNMKSMCRLEDPLCSASNTGARGLQQNALANSQFAPEKPAVPEYWIFLGWQPFDQPLFGPSRAGGRWVSHVVLRGSTV